MTVGFAVLLITVLLTVSVNQRIGEIAALRALGFSRARVVKDVLSESALIVGIGGLASLPLGLLLASLLDRILKIDGEVGSKKAYDPRSYLAKAEAALSERVKQAVGDLRATGKTMMQ